MSSLRLFNDSNSKKCCFPGEVILAGANGKIIVLGRPAKIESVSSKGDNGKK